METIANSCSTMANKSMLGEPHVLAFTWRMLSISGSKAFGGRALGERAFFWSFVFFAMVFDFGEFWAWLAG